jgi:photosystem II stability/assembly factor-like uncharacterized protein
MSRRALILLSLILAFNASYCYCQWAKVADRVLGSIQGGGGAITSANSDLWAGARSLWKSTDQGVTWTQQTFPLPAKSIIFDIEFLDRNNGIITTLGGSIGAIFQTSDGGSSWKQIYNQYATMANFGGGPSHVVANVGSGFVVTHDGGATWTAASQTIAPGALTRLSSSLYTIARFNHSTQAYLSTSAGGDIWTPAGTPVPVDTYTLGFGCNSMIVAPHENFYLTEGTGSSILATTDFGNTWNTLFSHPKTGYIIGAIAIPGRPIYCPTRSDGILRSVDLGKSWQLIGGPVAAPDTRSIVAVDDNTIIALDTSGSIWRTTNSGGRPVRYSSGNSYNFSPSLLFDGDTLSKCNSPVIRSAWFCVPLCEGRAISQSISGPDANYFSLTRRLPNYSSGCDSIAISFHADAARDYHATYTATMGDTTIVLQLNGHGRNEIRTFASDSALHFDTVTVCKDGRRFAYLHTVSCTSWKVKQLSISGTDSRYFQILSPLAFTLHGFDSVQTVFSPDSVRSYQAVLHVLLDDGTIKDIPLIAFGSDDGAKVGVDPGSLFTNDSNSVCDPPLIRSIFAADSACLKHSILRSRIIGQDSSAYSIISSPGPLPDSIVVSFHARGVKDHNAMLELLLSDSSLYQIKLGGAGKSVARTLSVTGRPTFLSPISACDPASISALILSDSSCSPWVVKSVSLSDSVHFHLIRSFPSFLTGRDTIPIGFQPDSAGTFGCTITVQLEDTSLTFLVSATGLDVRRALATTPNKLFEFDTLSLCDQPQISKLILKDSSCLPWSVRSYNWSGADSVFYQVIRRLPDTLRGTDTLGVTFMPDSVRAYSATLTLDLSDGTKVPIEFGGVGAPPATVSIATTNQSTSIIGGDIVLPILLAHTGHPASLVFRVRYDSSVLVIDEAKSESGHDLIVQRRPGSVILRIDSADIAQIQSGRIHFSMFPASDSCSKIVIDSVSFDPSMQPCALLLNNEVETEVCGPGGCTGFILTNFIRRSKLPSFSIHPNPAESQISITASEFDSQAVLRITNAMGSQVTQHLLDFQKNSTATVNIGGLPSGMYRVTFSDGQWTRSYPLIVLH